MEKKEKNAINIILICAILVLTLSIVTYLFSLRPWNQENNKSSEPSTEEAMSTDKNVDIAEALIGDTLPVGISAISASLSDYEDPISLYRQFLLRGDLMKGCNLDASQLRYRLYDIDQNGISELFFVTPKNADAEWMVIGRLWLDKDHQVRQSLVYDSSFNSVMIGTIQMDGKMMEAEYIERFEKGTLRFWSFYDPNDYNNPSISGRPSPVNYFSAYANGKYYILKDNRELEITEKEFPKFFDQADIIVGTGEIFDSYDRTVSYKELIGDESLNPEFKEYCANDDQILVDWKQNSQLLSDRTLNLTVDGILQTLPLAENTVVHFFVGSGDPVGVVYIDDTISINELIKGYKLTLNDGQGNSYLKGPAVKYVQVTNGQIEAIWVKAGEWN